MWRQLVEEGLVFLQEGGVFGLAREPFAFGRIGLLALLRGFEGEIVFFGPKVACKALAIR